MVMKSDLYAFMSSRALCVMSTVSAEGTPQAALINIAVTKSLELIFYTFQTNRKCANLRRDPRFAAVIGWEDERTLQYEGTAVEPRNDVLSESRKIYLERFPERIGPSTWPDLTFFRVRPLWIRYSNYDHPFTVEEFTFPDKQ